MYKYLILLFFAAFAVYSNGMSPSVIFASQYPAKVEGRSQVVKEMYKKISEGKLEEVCSNVNTSDSNIGFLNDCLAAAVEKCLLSKKVDIVVGRKIMISSAIIGANFGFYDSIVSLSKLTGKEKIVEAALHTMLLLMNPGQNRYAIIVECLERDASKVETIFGEGAHIDTPYIEDDRVIHRMSPVEFKFSSENIDRIIAVLNFADESQLKSATLNILTNWKKKQFIDSVPLQLK